GSNGPARDGGRSPAAPHPCRACRSRNREYPHPVETILVGYDGTAPAERALARAAEFARTFHSRVVVVSVAPPPSTADARVPGAFGLYSYYPSTAEQLDQTVKLDEEIWRQHREHVEALLAGAGVNIEFAGVAGQPVQ